MSTYIMTSFCVRQCAAVMMLTACFDAHAVDLSDMPAIDPAAVAMRQALTQRYPNTRFGDIERSAVSGLWEVSMGANVAYVTDDARHFIFGHLYDMQTQTDLTAAKKEASDRPPPPDRSALNFSDLPLADAIKTARGSGQRKLAVFSDPHCPYCRDLEQQLARVDNVTIYTFLYPIDALHPAAASVAQSIWCAKDRANAWKKFMATGKTPSPARCDTPIARNIALAASGGINGTPFILFDDGTTAAGALDAASVERRLAGH